MRAILCALLLGLALAVIWMTRSTQASDFSVLLPHGTTKTRAEQVSIDEFNRRFIEGCRKFDPEGTAKLWANDGVDLLPGMDPMVGKATIEKWLRGLAEQAKGTRILHCDVEWRESHVSGDVAYEWGINTQTVSLPDRSEPMKNKGKITLILRKQTDGAWKLALESWNSSRQDR
jgi:uncharacterized protein (TIGR02246 family)